MELGIFSLTDIRAAVDGGPRPTPGQRLDDVVAYGVLADRLGLDVFGVGEHHSHDFAVSSPAPVLAAVARATGRVRLVATATVLTAHDPVRVYQDYATLDLLSHGRGEIVAGRSAFAEPLLLFGVDPDRLDQVYGEKLDLLLRCRDHERVTWTGTSRPDLLDAEVPPRPWADPLPVWVGVGGSPTSALRAGDLGLPMMLGLVGGTLDNARRLVDTYRLAGEEAGHDATTLRVGLAASLYVGAATAFAREDVYPYYRRYLSAGPGRAGGWDVSRDQMNDLSERGGALLVGGPEQVSARILDLHERLGVDRFLGQVDFGGMPRAMVEESVGRFAEEVAPAVRAAVG
ncbi:LLM class flavin-dependent oxidoreductase [Georgenia sp. SUBG003]|uniref:LLM class flavin-dependent oxidoreductase n=1 Tax=Georgenia sp. SUBG003 TaxID=1497974 RepID=UPI0004D99740|nr:oxidoreductase [Georgenia sp. SUBG003]